jgi:general secretion pathway protein K
MQTHPQAHRLRQRGAALLIAMIILTLMATLASSMVWQQWRAVQVEAAERARIQSAWILMGALDWARLILREDARNGGADHLGEVWATPLAEARLSTFLAADQNNTDDGPEAFLSGSMTDAQSRYNLRNLVDPGTGKVLPAEQAILERLFESIAVSADVAARIAKQLNSATSLVNPAPNSPLPPESVAELTWLGIDEATVQLIQPYVVMLPIRTHVNLNTASAQVLAAVIDKLDLGGAERLVQARQRSYFRSVLDAQNVLGANFSLDPAGRVGVNSSFFEVAGRLRLGDRTLEERSMVQRTGQNNMDIRTFQRRRVNLRDSAFGGN